ncbi:MAG: GNAT family N-acetyltransferase [Candidatus Kariarchaeaceae archaeon]
MEIRKAIEEDAEATGELLVYCYDMSRGAMERFSELFKKTKEDFYSVIEKEKVVGSARIIPFEQNIRGSWKKMGGIAIVTSAPEVRMKGYIRELMHYMFREMYEAGQVFSALYPFKDSYYARFGYINALPRNNLEFDAKQMSKWKKLPEGYTIKRYNAEEGWKILREVQEKAIEKIHGGVKRPTKRWEELMGRYPGWIIVAYNKKGEAEGAMRCNLKGFGNEVFGPGIIGEMSIEGNYWLTLKARHALFQFIYTHTDQTKKVSMPINPNEGNYYSWIENYAKPKVDLHMVNMGRIIDAAKCLEGMKVKREGKVSLKIIDPICEWNNKTIEIVSKEGKLTVEGTKEEEIEMTIEGLTALVYGVMPIEEIEYCSWMKGGEEAKKKLGEWFPRKDPWMVEDF